MSITLTKLLVTPDTFPFLYNNRPRKVAMVAYCKPQVCLIKADDPDLPCYYYDPIVNQMPAYMAQKSAKSMEKTIEEDELVAELLETFELPAEVETILEDEELFTDDTTQGNIVIVLGLFIFFWGVGQSEVGTFRGCITLRC